MARYVVFAPVSQEVDNQRLVSRMLSAVGGKGLPFTRRDGIVCWFSDPDQFFVGSPMFQSFDDSQFLAQYGIPINRSSARSVVEDIHVRNRCDVDGTFTIIAGRRDNVRVVCDYLGIYPVFYSTGPQGTAVSDDPRLAAVLSGNQLTLDPILCLEWIITEGNLGDQSPINGVFRLRGNTVLSLERPGGCKFLNRGNAELESPPTLEELVDGLENDLRYVADHCHYLICYLTAGYDSRLNLSLLLHAGIDFECATYKHPSEDSMVAIEITKTMGITHHINWESHGRVPMPICISGNGAATAKGHYYKDSHGFSTPNEDLLRRYLTPYRRMLCGSNENYTVLRDRAIAEFERLSQTTVDPYHALDLFHLNRSRSWYGRTLRRPNNSTYAPLIDRRFVKFASTYQPHQKVQRQVNLDIIEYCEPELLNIRFQNQKASIRNSLLTTLPSSLQSVALRIDTDLRSKRVRIPDHIQKSRTLPRLFTEDQILRLVTSGKSYVDNFVEFENSVSMLSRYT